MKILSIFKKELTQNIRNFKGMIMMVLFPIVLILVLGTALSGMFDNTAAFKDVRVLYTNTGNSNLSTAFNKFISEKGENIEISYSPADSVQSGLDSVKDTKYAAYIRINNDAGEIEIYKNERYDFKANLVEAVMSSFIQRYNVISEIITESPEKAGNIANESIHGHVKTVPLTENRQPNSMDYYAITMLTLIIMYSSLTGFWSIRGEKTEKTIQRLLCSPARKFEILLGKILGSFAITLFQACIVVLFSRFILKTYWGDNMFPVLLLIAAEIIMAVSVGIGIGFVIKNESAATGILNMLIPIIVFLGGGYVPLESFNGVLLKISDISPLRWINKAIFQVVFSNDFSSVLSAVIINLLVAGTLLMISSIKFKKEAA